MSGQLGFGLWGSGHTTKPVQELLTDWQRLRSRLEPLVYCGPDQCRESLLGALATEDCPASATVQIAKRMSELACAFSSTPTLWQLFRAATGFPDASLARLSDLSRSPWVAFGFHPTMSAVLATNDDDEASCRPAADAEVPAALPLHQQAFAADISEGKGHALYNAHSYHTKVPHRAIMRYILHYTQPGELVFDGFAGTGMTGVAAGLCGHVAELAGMGFQVDGDGRLRNSGSATSPSPVDYRGQPLRAGARRAVLMDLSPAAALISATYNSPQDAHEFERIASHILDELRAELGWMYVTLAPAESVRGDSLPQQLAREVERCRDAKDARKIVERIEEQHGPLGTVRMVAWSDVVQCPNCGAQFLFSRHAVDPHSGKVAKRLDCPACDHELWKRDLLPVLRQDGESRTTSSGGAVREPFCIHFEWEGRIFTKTPDAFDLALARLTSRLPIQDWYPSERLFRGRETRRNDRRGITHVHHFYTPRNLRFLAALRRRCLDRHDLLLWFTSQLSNLSYLNRYRPDVTFPYNPLSGTLYVGARVAESNPLVAYSNKIGRLARAFRFAEQQNVVLCGSLVTAPLPDESVDYIFTDPPFGANLAYSELNVLTESWLGAYTHRLEEAIENRSQGKTAEDYAEIMRRCFAQYFRILKPGKWLTVEFHHTQPHVWRALQQALQSAGFVIADIRTLDKQLGSFKQVNNPGSVKQDLVLSAWKPTTPIKTSTLRQGSEDEVWRFVKRRVESLRKDGQARELQTELQPHLMFNRTVAALLQRGATVPLSAAQFYKGYAERFAANDDEPDEASNK